MDSTIGLWILIALVGAGIGLIIGRAMDPYERVRWKRRFGKRDAGLISILSKDRMSIIKTFGVDFNKSKVVVDKKRFGGQGEEIWVIDKGSVWREDYPTKSSILNKTMREGVPIAFVSYDNLESINFDQKESGARPDEVGAILSAWFNNQEAKRIAAKKKTQMDQILEIATIAGILILLYLIYQQGQQIDAIKTTVQALANATSVIR